MSSSHSGWALRLQIAAAREMNSFMHLSIEELKPIIEGGFVIAKLVDKIKRLSPASF